MIERNTPVGDPSENSVLQFTPDGRFTAGKFTDVDGDPAAVTELPFLGWAVVVRWVRNPDDRPGGGDYETHLDPVFLEEIYPTAATDLLRHNKLKLIELVQPEPGGMR